MRAIFIANFVPNEIGTFSTGIIKNILIVANIVSSHSCINIHTYRATAVLPDIHGSKRDSSFPAESVQQNVTCEAEILNIVSLSAYIHRSQKGRQHDLH